LASERSPVNLALAYNTISMPISIQIEDERGVREGEAWWNVRSTAVLVGEHPGTCCLRFIDPYGDTIFNRGQIPVLLEELRVLSARESDAELATILVEVARFVERAANQIHTYVRFVGD
jgi:hypothetical protein